ncbi:MAG: GNAT family N-acetyltransferase [Nocardioidaceae bacterium]|nr:GNAT family N-acetyltransferase [Nocardioidaceae bacterium]
MHVVEADWARVRAVRLTALAESPRAFGSSHAREAAYDEADWRRWCRDTSTFLATRDGAPIGMVAGVGGTSHDERKVVAMWLDPGHRGTGAAAALLVAV